VGGCQETEVKSKGESKDHQTLRGKQPQHWGSLLRGPNAIEPGVGRASFAQPGLVTRRVLVVIKAWYLGPKEFGRHTRGVMT